MNAVGRDLAVVINQGVEKSKFGGAADAAPAPAAPEPTPAGGSAAEAGPAEATA
jgi:large subunit ribosomal protein L10